MAGCHSQAGRSVEGGAVIDMEEHPSKPGNPSGLDTTGLKRFFFSRPRSWVVRSWALARACSTADSPSVKAVTFRMGFLQEDLGA